MNTVSASDHKIALRRLAKTAAAGAFVIALALTSAYAAGGGAGGGGGGGEAEAVVAVVGAAEVEAVGRRRRIQSRRPARHAKPRGPVPSALLAMSGIGRSTSACEGAAASSPTLELTEYAFALASADRFQEALDVLDILDNSNTPRALNYRGYATRKLGRIDEGIGYYLQSIALDPEYPQVREYLGEAYVIEGKFDLAKDQLTTIGKLCGVTDCAYYQSLSKALDDAHAL